LKSLGLGHQFDYNSDLAKLVLQPCPGFCNKHNRLLLIILNKLGLSFVSSAKIGSNQLLYSQQLGGYHLLDQMKSASGCAWAWAELGNVADKGF
jgi:hypothetical protein